MGAGDAYDYIVVFSFSMHLLYYRAGVESLILHDVAILLLHIACYFSKGAT